MALMDETGDIDACYLITFKLDCAYRLFKYWNFKTVVTDMMI